MSSLNVEMTYLRAVNFAMQQNRVPLIRELHINNQAGCELANVTMTISPSPSFALPVTVSVGKLSVGEEKVLDSIRLNLQPNFFAQLTEGMTGDLNVTVTADGLSPHHQEFPIDVLAYDQWCGSGILPEMLAAFVTPNHPAIAPILRRASEWMEKWTGRSALDEYQSRNINRVRQQMAAIYTALAEQFIAYATVPASFDERGQRIRLADTVLTQKLGNCIELSILYAACLEASGIHPLVVLVKGHAFAGGWLISDTFPDSITDDAAFLTKRMADGVNEIVLLEATALSSDGKLDFEQAVKASHAHLKDSSKFLYALDVKRCRFAGVRPLPQRVQSDGHWVIHEEDPKGDIDAQAPQSVTPYDLPQTVAVSGLTKQMLWERKLLDLSLRNNLLNIRITKNTLQIISANLHEVEDALADGAEFRILSKPTDWDSPLYEFGLHRSVDQGDPVVDLIKSELTQHRLRAYLSEDQLPIALTHLYRASRLAIEESGANTLYIALGLLKWFETPSSERPRYAPILLLPVEIIRKSSAKGYVIRSRDEESFLNITLLEMLRQNFNLNIAGLEPLPRDDSGVDVRKIYTIIRQGIKNQRGWDVEEHAMLGLFSFNTFIMWNDIHSHADILARNPIVSSLMKGKIEWETAGTTSDATVIDHTLSPADILLPVPADSSQLEAVHEAISGTSFILHGPPGTGKSQTITNIVANALYRGKRVLFVAEKMAALSVVEERLRKIGLGPFCLELHSNKVQKSSVLSQLKETAEVVRHQSPLEFEQEAKRLYELRAQINAYAQGLHRKNSFGLSLYDAVPRYLSTPGERVFDFPPERLDGQTVATLAEWLDAVEDLASVGRACGHPHKHPLEGVGLADYSANLQTSAETALTEFVSLLRAVTPHVELISKITGIPESVPLNTNWLDSAQRVLSRVQSLPACVPSESLFGLDPKMLLADWNTQSQKWFLPRWLGQRRLRAQIARHFVAEPREWKVQEVLVSLSELNDAVRDFAQDVSRVKEVKQRIATQLSEGFDIFSTLYGPALRSFFDWQEARQIAAKRVKEVLTVERELPSTIDEASALATVWINNLHRLKDWSRWITTRNRLITYGIGFVAAEYKDQNISVNTLVDAYNKSLYHATIVYSISHDRALEMFNGKLFNEIIEKYQAMAARFELLAKLELRARLSANIPSFTIEAAQNSEVGILQRNIRNNGRGTSIRKLFDQIPTLLPRMCPCMLMSPMSVAQYMDVDANAFDLVIFDEASQMPTSEAVGALARGKSVVIVGDPKQMPPTDFFTAQTFDEENVDVEDMESVLDDCLALSIPSKYLLWHYRSRHESLIAFSNAEYYENALYTFPSPDNIASKVSLVSVPGCYEKGKSRTNKAEAQAVVNEIERRLSDSDLRSYSIGVVTFSSVQQTLVEDLLGALFARRPDLEQVALECAEPVFVKNLENVQGDERDVILFSICYGPDESGRVSMNFGPLNREGGERRLNVAVSRARHEMVVFATLLPEQIDLNRTCAAGVAGLKRFLEYARSRTTRTGTQGADIGTVSLANVVANELNRLGFTVHTDVGSSRYRIDIGIVDPDNPSRYKLGILCDGKNYAHAKTARDREIVQRETLRRLGWNLCRVWTMDWMEDPQAVLQSISEALVRAKPAQTVAKTCEPEIPLHVIGTGDVSMPTPQTVKDRPKRDNPFDIPEDEIATVIREHLELQVSLPEEDLLRLVARTFGYARMGSNVEASMRKGLAHAEKIGALKIENGRVAFQTSCASSNMIRSGRATARCGQAAIEFIACLLLFLLVLTGLIHVNKLARTSLFLHGVLRGNAGAEAMSQGALSVAPPYVSDWQAGADGVRYTADDRAVDNPLMLPATIGLLADDSVKNPGDWTYVVSDTKLPVSMITLHTSPMAAATLGFAHAEETLHVPVDSVIRQLVYGKDEVAVKEEVWMPLMGGLY